MIGLIFFVDSKTYFDYPYRIDFSGISGSSSISESFSANFFSGFRNFSKLDTL